MKQIAMSFGMLAFVGAVVVGGTGAFFSDTETSTGNVFTAGAVNIQMGGILHGYQGGELSTEPTPVEFSVSDAEGMSFAFDDLKPLDWGKVQFELENTDNAAHICVMVEENGDLSEPGQDGGNLADHLSFMFESDSGHLSDVAGQWYNLTHAESVENTSAAFDYCFGEYDDEVCQLENIDYNPLQLAALGVNVYFEAVQSRNNENFDCASLNEEATEIEFVLGEDERTMVSVGHNSENEDNELPYVSWEINGDEIDFTFHNPTNNSREFFFDYRVDGESGDEVSGVTGETSPSGRLEGQEWGDFYNFVSVGAGETETETVTGTDEIQVRLFLGPERDYDFDWITFEAQQI